LDGEGKEEKKNQNGVEEGRYLYCCQGTLIDASASEDILSGSQVMSTGQSDGSVILPMIPVQESRRRQLSAADILKEPET
jgi:hypothetical protein